MMQTQFTIFQDFGIDGATYRAILTWQTFVKKESESKESFLCREASVLAVLLLERHNDMPKMCCDSYPFNISMI